MERKIYLLGTSHEYQRGDKTCPPNSIDEFKQYLESICQEYDIRAIGEEMSLTALEDFNLTNSIPERFAQEKGLKHKHCDPDRDEQKRLGIKELGYFTQPKKLPERMQPEELRNITPEEAEELERKENFKREPSWLHSVLELNVWPLLFICGSKHVESFSKLLATETLSVNVISECWQSRNK